MATKASHVTSVSAETVPAGAVAIAGETHSYVDWPAIFAGTLLSAAISFVMLTFGSGIGLSATSPFPGEGTSAPWFAIAAAIWFVWIVVSSFLAGGYLTGRLRRRVGNATHHEVVVRDGAHGLVVWALGTVTGAVLGALLASSAIFGVAKGGTEVAGRGTAAIVAGGDNREPFGYAIDLMFRSNQGAAAGDAASVHREVATILASGAVRGELAPDDRAYLVRMVSAHTGMPLDAATKRVDETLTKLRQVANKARKTGIVLAFLAAATLLVGAAAAWSAATVGGRHRDEQVDFSRFIRRR